MGVVVMPSSVPPSLAEKVRQVNNSMSDRFWSVLPRGSYADLVQTVGDDPYTRICSGTMREVEKFMDGFMYCEAGGKK